jgi:glutamate synthase domain-containing protein 3
MHLTETDSAVAAKVLGSWATESANFRKVMPRDYKRVLEVMADAKSSGLSEEETLNRVMEVARG